MNIVVSNIQPAPDNVAGATIAAYYGIKTTPPMPIVLFHQDGHRLITQETALDTLDAFWRHSKRYGI